MAVTLTVLGSAIGLYLNGVVAGNIILFIGLAIVFFIISCYLLVLAGVIWRKMPIWPLDVSVTLPLPSYAFSTAANNLGNWPGFLPAIKTTILMNFVFLSILSLSALA